MQALSAGVTQGANKGLQTRKEWKGGCEQETQSGAFKLIFLVAEPFLFLLKKKKGRRESLDFVKHKSVAFPALLLYPAV